MTSYAIFSRKIKVRSYSKNDLNFHILWSRENLNKPTDFTSKIRAPRCLHFYFATDKRSDLNYEYRPKSQKVSRKFGNF